MSEFIKSSLLSQAIADAKAVRATALSNAKAALEEHFAPKLQSMLSAKLKEDLAAEEAEGSDEEGQFDVAPEGGGEDAPLPVADVNVDVEPGAEANVDADAPIEAPVGAPAEAPVGAADAAPIDGQAPVEEPAAPIPGDEEEVDEDTFRGTTAAELDPTMRSNQITETEKASPDYKKTTTGHKTEDPGKSMVKPVGVAIGNTKGGPKAGPAERTASSDYKKDAPNKTQIKNIKPSGTEDPQGPSKELADGPDKNSETPTSALKENEEVDEASLDEILKELESSVNEVGMEEEGSACAPVAAPEEEEIDLNELLSEADEDDEKKDEKKDEDDEKEEDKEDKRPEWLKENISLKKDLTEYRNTVIFLRDRLNEVNLLNAKLLYTNKLFKQTSLTNEQKLKVIESFDLTKSVREAKLVYATLAESFNFGAKKPAPQPVKKTVSGTVRSITEGLASKAVASTKPTKPILSEGAEMASRFQKLAGIRK